MIKCKIAINAQLKKFKDFTSRVDRITSIPVEPLEVISFLVFSVSEKKTNTGLQKKNMLSSTN